MPSSSEKLAVGDRLNLSNVVCIAVPTTVKESLHKEEVSYARSY